jgi:hypothetical protein
MKIKFYVSKIHVLTFVKKLFVLKCFQKYLATVVCLSVLDLFQKYWLVFVA